MKIYLPNFEYDAEKKYYYFFTGKFIFVFICRIFGHFEVFEEPDFSRDYK